MGMLTNITLKNTTAGRLYMHYNPDLVARICYHTKIGKHYSDLIRGIFGNSSDRLKFIINTQAAWMGPLEIFYLCEGEYYKSYDLVAIAPYMSSDMKDADGNLISLEDFFNSTISASIKESLNFLQTTFNLVNSSTPKMEIGLYEAG